VTAAVMFATVDSYSQTYDVYGEFRKHHRSRVEIGVYRRHIRRSISRSERQSSRPWFMTEHELQRSHPDNSVTEI
jgi:hypothetical protein